MKRRSFLKGLFCVPAVLVTPTLLAQAIPSTKIEFISTPSGDNEFLAMYKGKCKYDAGYYYAPYIPRIKNVKVFK